MQATSKKDPWSRRFAPAAICLALWIVMITLAAPVPIRAQDGLERLEREIELTTERLLRAREIIQADGQDNPRAARQLQIAVVLQERAIALAQIRPVRPANVLQALDFTRRARHAAERAIQIAAQQASLEQRAQKAIEQLARYLERASDRIGDAPSDRAQRQLEIAHLRLERAKESFHEHHFAEALHIANETLRTLESVLRDGRTSDLEHLFQNTTLLVERAQEVVEETENDRARSMVDNAARQLGLAKESLEAGNPTAARNLLQQARDLARRALRLVEAVPELPEVDRVLRDTSEFVNEMARQIRDIGNEDAERMIENALQHLERAGEHRTNQQLRRAVAEARVARNLARRAAQIAGITLF